MGTLIFKSYLAIILIVMTLTACAEGGNKMEIIAYGTPEFTEFVKKAPVSLDKAWDIQLAFYKSNPKEMEYSLYKQSAALYFIIDKYYVYTLIPLVKTKPKGKLLSGIWVNSITGEVKYVDNNTIVEAESFSGWAK